MPQKLLTARLNFAKSVAESLERKHVLLPLTALICQMSLPIQAHPVEITLVTVIRIILAVRYFESVADYI